MLPLSSTSPSQNPHLLSPFFPSFSHPISLSLPSPLSPKPKHPPRPPKPLCIRSLDAAQPFDYESRLKSQYLKSTSLKIAIIGFGNFGQFLAKTFVSRGHTLLSHSRSDHSEIAQKLGVQFYADPHDLCEQHPEVVILSTSILSFESVLRAIPLQRLKRNTLFVDVLSVKEFPRNLMLKYLPEEFDILCTHPMFGPESGKDSWIGLPFMYDKVRIRDEDQRVNRCERFLDIFGKEGCRMVEMSSMEHDRYAAGSQFITHTMGRVLQRYGLESTPINTKGYETLLDLVRNTVGDSFDLYYGLFMYNNNALEQLERLDMAFAAIRKELFGQLHQVYRKQLFGYAEERPVVAQKLLHSDALMESPPESSRREAS